METPQIFAALIVGAVFLFVLPAATAWWRTHHSRLAIAALNLLAPIGLLFPGAMAWGCIALLWGAALVWSLTAVRRPTP